MNFSHPIRVYFADTDAGGVVYHASYLDFMERARAEWLRAMGFSNSGLIGEFGIVFVVREVNVTYYRPARLDDLLDIGVEIESVGRSQVVVKQKIMRQDAEIAAGKIHLVCARMEPFKPVSIPELIRSKLENRT